MGNTGRKFLLLLWKNYMLQKRKVFVTILEIGLPTFFAVLLVFVRQRVDSTEVAHGKNYSYFEAQSFPWDLCPARPKCFPEPFARRWQLFYTPNDTFTTHVMRNVHQNLSWHIYKTVPYDSEDKMVDDILNAMENFTANSSNATEPCDILGAIVFNKYPKDNTDIHNVEYKIRLRYSWGGMTLSSISDILDEERGKWHTELMYPGFQSIGPRNQDNRHGGPPDYFQDGFLTLQYHLDTNIIQMLNQSAYFARRHSRMSRFPYPPWRDDKFVMVLQQQFPLIIILSFIFSTLHIVKDVVHEKERKIKETLKMMGVNNWIHWSAWFIKYFLFLLISVFIMTVFFSAPISSHGSVVGFSSASIIFVFLLSYAVATISFCFMVSVFFSKANSAAAASGVLFFVTYIPYLFIDPRYENMSWAGKMSSCLISNVAMSMGSRLIGMFEGTGSGIHWNTINKGVSVDDNFTMLSVIVMLLFDAFLYSLVTWYVEAVFPGEYGVPQRWFFPFQPSYWCGFNHRKNVYMEEEEEDERTPLMTTHLTQSDYFEADPVGLTPGIKIKNLRKVYKSSATAAVKGTSMNMYDGQITALLGHNGAGKTTTIFMLTGFMPPTEGSAVVNGYDIRSEISNVRESLGLCPQHNVLFDSLTVHEHLTFFAWLKKVPKDKVAGEVDKYLSVLGLKHKANAASKNLSGGQKRKLSVGLALIGGSKIVILDEPTSGMDPNARRQTWDILQKHKEGRTVILTTHYMDEADVLGDRIAIMADGVIKCCGTPLFLKNKYGAGYHLVMVKEASCDVDVVTDLVRTHVTSVQLESNVSAELRYLLPYESKCHFQKLFTDLESQRERLGIASFGVSVTTMEEVFLRVGECGNEDGDENIDNSYSSLSPLSTLSVNAQATGSTGYSVNTLAIRKPLGFQLLVQQFCGLFVKRVLHTWRNLLVTIAQLLIPLFFTIMSLVVMKTMPKFSDSPALPLNMSYFGDNYIPYNHSTKQGDITQQLSQSYQNQFSAFPFVHPKSINSSVSDYLFRFGEDNIAVYNENYLIAGAFVENTQRNSNTTDSVRNVTSISFFNNQAFHTPAMSLGATMNAWLQYFTNKNASLTTINHPLPRTRQQKVNENIIQGLEGFTVAFNVLFGMAFLASSFTLFIIRERATKAKHVQFVSGVNCVTFWLSTFLWDFLNYMIPVVFLLITFAAFGLEAYVGDNRLSYITLLFCMYGWSVLPLMYLMSFIFTVPSSGLVWLTMFNILTGVATVLAVDILSIPQLNTTEIAHSLEWTFLTILPSFCLGQGLEDFYENHQFLQICTQPYVLEDCELKVLPNPCCKDFCGDFCVEYQENYLSMGQGGIGRMLVFMACQGFVFFAILIIIELKVVQMMWYLLRNGRSVKNAPVSDGRLLQEDNDVALERQRIVTTPLDTLHRQDALVLDDLSKYYGNLLAVDRISVGIPQGECFGLLGINGAGKTSTFKMLTGDEMITSGNAYVETFNVKTDIMRVQQRLGYCPQFDALIDQMTGRETLVMFARLRGVDENSIPMLVSQLLSDLMLNKHADKLVKAFSGGNKRKLSTAIALIGDPSIVFLDEPSTGMDPMARRQLWNTLSRVRAQGRTLVLTSHSMEECEALCTRIAIMVNGQFKCIGSPQHLKNKFGEGYTLIAKIKPSDSGEIHTQEFMDFVAGTFPGCILKDVHQGMLHYHITDNNISWSAVFGIMEKARDKFNLEDYSISQTTLEQVFINFARSQIPPVEVAAGCCSKMSSACCCCCKSHDDEQESLLDED